MAGSAIDGAGDERRDAAVTGGDAGGDAAGAVTAARESIARAVADLERAGVPDEALADFVTPRRVLFVNRAPVMVPRGRVWPLGVLLLDRNGTLHATGTITRAVPAGYPGYQSPGVEVRRGYRAAAFRADFAEGDTVNFDTAAIDLERLDAASGPLLTDSGRVLVRWNPTFPTQTRRLDVYLADRVGLLVDPPGA